MPVAERTARTGYLPQDPYLFSGTIATTSCWARHPASGAGLRPAAAQVSRCWQRPCLAPPLVRICAPFLLAWNGNRRTGHTCLRWSAPAHSTGTGHGGLRHAGARTGPGRSVLGPGPGYGSQDRRWLAPALRPVAAIRPAVHGRAVLAPPAGLSPADLIVVLDRGRIVEQGTHAELSTGNGLPPVSTEPSVWQAQEALHRGHPVNSTRTSTTTPQQGGITLSSYGACSSLALAPRPGGRLGAPGRGAGAGAAAPGAADRRCAPGAGPVEGLLWIAALYLGATAAVQVTGFLTEHLTATIAQGVLRRLRVRLFACRCYP